MIIIALSVSRTPSLSLGCIASIETCVIGGKEEECTPIWPSKESAHLGGPFKRDWSQLSQNFSKKLFKISWYVNHNNHVGFFVCFSVSPFLPQVSSLILEKNAFWVYLQIAQLPLPLLHFLTYAKNLEQLSKKWNIWNELCHFPNQIIPFNNTILYPCLGIENANRRCMFCNSSTELLTVWITTLYEDD